MNELNNADDVLLSTILKLVGGDKEQCHQMIQVVREQYPAKSIRWCMEKVIYDLRYGKPQVKKPASNWETKVARAYQASTPYQKLNTSPPPPAAPSSPSPAAPSSPSPAAPSSPSPAAPSSPSPPPAAPSPSFWGPTGIKLSSSPSPDPQIPTHVSLSNLQSLAKAKQQMPKKQRVNESTKKQLYKLAGNWDVVNRLVERIQLNNPTQSEQWAYEKAIWDLERDRL